MKLDHQPKRITAPENPAVSLADVKKALHIDHTDDDNQLTDEIASAVEHYVGWTGILGGVVIGEQQWRQDFDRIEQRLFLPIRPISEIVSIIWRDVEGVETTIGADNYALLYDRAGRPYVRFHDSYEIPNFLYEIAGASVDYTAGYEETPADIKSAIILRVQLHYDMAAAADGQHLERLEKSLLAKYRPPGI